MTEPILSEAEHDAITDAAAHWCMRLHAADCTPAEREAFARWLAAHPMHAFEYEAIQEVWDIADHLPRPHTEHITPAAAPVLPARPRRSRRRTYGLAAAISLLALPLVAYSGWNLGLLPSTYETFESGASVRHVTLADGSSVELNLGSQLTYSNYKDQRRVTLSKGEAFFDVSHDAEHPFVVRAGEGRIRVTGTRFNVWMYEDQVRVTLLEGSVLVSSNRNLQTDGFRLEPGMQASYRSGDFEPRLSQSAANDPNLAWRNGKLILDNLALTDALPLINRYLKTPVMLADHTTGRIRIGGIYNTQEVAGLIGSLPKVLPVYLTRNRDGNPVLNSIPRVPPES